MAAQGFWQLTNRGTTGVAATVSLAAPTNAAANATQIRVRTITATVAGSAAGADELTVKDGSNVIFSADLAILATDGFASIVLPALDLRTTPGNTLTVAFTSGITSAFEDVNVQGDYVSVGTAHGFQGV